MLPPRAASSRVNGQGLFYICELAREDIKLGKWFSGIIFHSHVNKQCLAMGLARGLRWSGVQFSAFSCIFVHVVLGASFTGMVSLWRRHSGSNSRDVILLVRFGCAFVRALGIR